MRRIAQECAWREAAVLRQQSRQRGVRELNGETFPVDHASAPFPVADKRNVADQEVAPYIPLPDLQIADPRNEQKDRVIAVLNELARALE
jgi:hypothetical protein